MEIVIVHLAPEHHAHDVHPAAGRAIGMQELLAQLIQVGYRHYERAAAFENAVNACQCEVD